MQPIQFSVMELLENRTLLSHGADDPVIIADKATLADDKAVFQTHRHELELELADDRRGIREAEHQRKLDSAPLKQKIQDDKIAGKAQLADDKANLKATLAADKLELKDDKNALKQHRGDDAQLAIDHAELENDRARYLSDRQAGKQLIQQHKDDLKGQIRDDRLALVTFLHTPTAAMTAAQQEFDDDRVNGQQELEDDHNRIDEDKVKLREDSHGVASASQLFSSELILSI